MVSSIETCATRTLLNFNLIIFIILRGHVFKFKLVNLTVLFICLDDYQFKHWLLFQYESSDLNDTKIYCQPPLPSADSTFVSNSNTTSTGPLPAREDYPGPFSFSVLLDGVESTKNKWTVSTLLLCRT